MHTSQIPTLAIPADAGGSSTVPMAKIPVRYRECMKNHALALGGHATDGCGEFMPAGEENTAEGFKCVACSCHRNFHRKEEVTYLDVSPLSEHTVVTHDDVGDHTRINNHVISPMGKMEVKKRFRTKFTAEQKDKMFNFAESIGWKIQKDNEAAVDTFCGDIMVTKQVLKIWLQNNKTILRKKPSP